MYWNGVSVLPGQPWKPSRDLLIKACKRDGRGMSLTSLSSLQVFMTDRRGIAQDKSLSSPHLLHASERRESPGIALLHKV